MPDLDAFLDWIGDGRYDLPPINGKVYTVPSPSIEDGKFLTRLWSVGQKAARHDSERAAMLAAAGGRPLNAQENRRLDALALSKAEVDSLHLDDDDERDLWERVLGSDLIAQMSADGLNAEQLKRIGTYAWTRFTAGEETADRTITEAGAAGKASSSTATARATTTPRRTSGSATRSRKTASRR